MSTKRKSKLAEYTGVLAEPIYLASALAHRVDPSGKLESVERDRGIKQLKARKFGRRTLILRGDLLAFLAALPLTA